MFNFNHFFFEFFPLENIGGVFLHWAYSRIFFSLDRLVFETSMYDLNSKQP